MKPKEVILEKQFPSVELAYVIAVASYDSAMKRLDAIDARLQTILAFVVSVSALAPASANGGNISFVSWWFCLAVILFLTSMVIGIWARLSGETVLLSPAGLFAGWLHLQPGQFQIDIISDAADAFTKNKNLVNFKWKCMVTISLLFAAEAVCLGAWVVAGHP